MPVSVMPALPCVEYHITVTDPAGKWKKFTRDAMGQLTQVEEPRPGGGTYKTTYVYDALGHMTTASMTRDGVTQTQTWAYNVQQRLASVTLPESGTTSYDYNADGTLLRRTDAKGQKVEYTYDSASKWLTKIRRFPVGASVHDPCQSQDLSYGTTPIPQIQSAPVGRVTEVG